MRTVAEHIAEAESQGKHIEAGFRSLVAMAYPNGVGEAQYQDLRKFFFAGSSHLYGTLVNRMDTDREPTEADMALMQRVHDEIIEFKEQLRP